MRFERIAAPALIIHGDADTDVAPAHSDRAAAAIPEAQRLSLARGTHLALFVHPEAEANARQAQQAAQAKKAGRQGKAEQAQPEGAARTAPRAGQKTAKDPA